MSGRGGKTDPVTIGVKRERYDQLLRTPDFETSFGPPLDGRFAFRVGGRRLFSAEGSYGVYAAKLAGLPRPVVRRAEELLREYEGGEHSAAAEESAAGEALEQFDASTWGRGASLVEELLRTDLDSLSPVEALMKLFELRRAAEGEAGKAKALKSA